MINLNKKKKQFFFIFIIIIIISIYLKIYININNIIKYKFDDRISAIYGFCSNESIGYLKFLKKKYKLDNNPKVINYIHTPNVTWAIIDPKKINKNSEDFIFLNYPGEKLILTLNEVNKVLYKFKEIYFYLNKVDKIESFEIILKNHELKLPIELKIYSKIDNQPKKILHNFKSYEKKNNKIKFQLNINLKNLYKQNNTIFFELKNIEKNKINKISLIGQNKFLLRNFEIINNYEKCYYAKKL